MRIAIAGGALLAAAALCLVPMGTAHAQVTQEPAATFFGNENTSPNLVTGKDQGKQATNALTVIYDNTTSAANGGISSTDLTAQWGDELFTTGTGLLSTQKFTMLNSGSSVGPVLTAVVGVQIYDAVTSALLGSYSTSINFGTGLPPGFYSIITVTGLDPLIILLPVTDLIVIQTVISKTGTANRLGVESLNPVTVGSSPTFMYIAASTVGAPGFYNIGVPAQPGYQLAVNPPPVGVKSSSWSLIKKLYR